MFILFQVNPYAPASKLLPIQPEHVEKVRSIMLDVAQQTTTEISFTTPRCQVLQIVGREGNSLMVQLCLHHPFSIITCGW